MSLVIPAGFANVSLQLRNDGDPEPWYVTYGIDVSEAGGDYATAATYAASAFENSILLQMTTATKSSSVRLSVGQDGGPPLTIVQTRFAAGTSTAAMLPQNCAALYDKQTDVAGRRGRGRMFVPNILKESEVSNVGVINGPAVVDLQAQADNFLENLNDNGFSFNTPMVVLHNNGPGLIPPTPVTAFTVQNIISTQRKRLR